MRLRFDRFVLDLDRGYLTGDEGEIALRPKTFELLCYFSKNPRRLLAKDELMSVLWPDVVVTDDSLVQCIAELRRALDDREHRLVATVTRRGYRFDATPTAEHGAAAAVEIGRRTVLPTQRWAAWVVGIVVLVIVGAGLAPTASDDDPPPLSIAVLPFATLGPDPDEARLAAAIAHDVTTDLSRVQGLFVIAHATARTFDGEKLDARGAARALNVRYALTGSVDLVDDTVRINAELVSARTGAALWAERFTTHRNALDPSRDELVGRIATTLNFRLTRLESERALRERRGDPETHDLTTRGWAVVYSGKKPSNYRAAREWFQRALSRDPSAVDALAGVGWTSAIMVLDGWSASPEADIALAAEAIDQALSVDRNHVVAHHVRGFLYRLEERSAAARDAFRTVVALNPNFAPGHAQLGITELELGRPAAVRPAVEKAIRLSPRDPSLGPWLAFLGMAELHMGNDTEAVEWLTRAVDTGTPVVLHQAYLVSALALTGRLAEARAALARLQSAAPSATLDRLRGTARSTVPDFVAQQERLFKGLRIAGLAP